MALSFPIDKFHKHFFSGNYHTYIMINASDEGICVEFWRKNNTTMVYILSSCRQVLNYFKNNPLNTIFDYFSIWLLGYKTACTCLYLPQGHDLKSTVWLWSTDECDFLYFEWKSLQSLYKLQYDNSFLNIMCMINMYTQVHWYQFHLTIPFN